MPCFDPIPRPTEANFIQDGTEPPQPPGDPLAVIDPSTDPGRFINFYCLADDEFGPADNPKEVVLAPQLSLDPGFVPASPANTGVHATINDGTKEIRAVLRASSGSEFVRVAILLAGGGFSSELKFSSLSANFTLKRLTNGDAVLSSFPNPDVVVAAASLPISRRLGVKTIEFGTYDVAASSTSNWSTLGLPSADQTPFAAFDPSGLSIKVFNNTDKVKVSGTFELATGQTIDPTTQPVSLALSRPAQASFWPPAGQPGTLFAEGPTGSFSLTAEGKTATGFNAFTITQNPVGSTSGEFNVVDQGAALVGGDFSQVNVEMRLDRKRGQNYLCGSMTDLRGRPRGRMVRSSFSRLANRLTHAWSPYGRPVALARRMASTMACSMG
jgi:hypothetical protein